MKNVLILGSTGSLGTQSLEVLANYPNNFKIIGLTCGTNKKLLAEQSQKFSVPNTLLGEAPESLIEQSDIIINVLPGTVGIKPSHQALNAGKILLLGNKESLVAGPLPASGRVIPLDSEHNAIYEIIQQNPNRKIAKITLPASGGPFWQRQNLDNITVKEALKHPSWKMGPKVTIESATLINKGFEIIEAHHLFDLPLEKIDAKIHSESQVHGLVTFEDGETLAYISPPDMREHIENALIRAINRIPKREIRPLKPDEFVFHPVPHGLLPGIKIVTAAYQKSPDKMLDFLQKEEKIIADFLNGKISFSGCFEMLIRE